MARPINHDDYNHYYDHVATLTNHEQYVNISKNYSRNDDYNDDEENNDYGDDHIDLEDHILHISGKFLTSKVKKC